STAAELYDRGQAVCAALNQEIAGFIESAFRVDSKLELEFEIVYDRFYLPTVRHAVGTEARGRAKGYAGRPIGRDGQPAAIDVKGMEAIRSDWTPVAQEFQRELLTLLFADASPDEIHGCVARCVGGVRDGTLDDRLVYSRRLRKGVGAYTKSKPPHVQAAELLPPEDRDGDIAYVITTAGPQPIAAMTAAIDHEHYVDRQIRPIAEPICEVAGVDPSALFEPTDQLSLF
ncbi:MAG: DNA polymerase II, partial [Spirochaetaceae bacterium]